MKKAACLSAAWKTAVPLGEQGLTLICPPPSSLPPIIQFCCSSAANQAQVYLCDLTVLSALFWSSQGHLFDLHASLCICSHLLVVALQACHLPAPFRINSCLVYTSQCMKSIATPLSAKGPSHCNAESHRVGAATCPGTSGAWR